VQNLLRVSLALALATFTAFANADVPAPRPKPQQVQTVQRVRWRPSFGRASSKATAKKAEPARTIEDVLPGFDPSGEKTTRAATVLAGITDGLRGGAADTWEQHRETLTPLLGFIVAGKNRRVASEIEDLPADQMIALSEKLRARAKQPHEPTQSELIGESPTRLSLHGRLIEVSGEAIRLAKGKLPSIVSNNAGVLNSYDMRLFADQLEHFAPEAGEVNAFRAGELVKGKKVYLPSRDAQFEVEAIDGDTATITRRYVPDSDQSLRPEKVSETLTVPVAELCTAEVGERVRRFGLAFTPWRKVAVEKLTRSKPLSRSELLAVAKGLRQRAREQDERWRTALIDSADELDMAASIKLVRPPMHEGATAEDMEQFGKVLQHMAAKAGVSQAEWDVKTDEYSKLASEMYDSLKPPPVDKDTLKGAAGTAVTSAAQSAAWFGPITLVGMISKYMPMVSHLKPEMQVVAMLPLIYATGVVIAQKVEYPVGLYSVNKMKKMGIAGSEVMKAALGMGFAAAWAKASGHHITPEEIAGIGMAFGAIGLSQNYKGTSKVVNAAVKYGKPVAAIGAATAGAITIAHSGMSLQDALLTISSLPLYWIGQGQANKARYVQLNNPFLSRADRAYLARWRVVNEYPFLKGGFAAGVIAGNPLTTFIAQAFAGTARTGYDEWKSGAKDVLSKQGWALLTSLGGVGMSGPQH